MAKEKTNANVKLKRFFKGHSRPLDDVAADLEFSFR
jgi:hypothetical protein